MDSAKEDVTFCCCVVVGGDGLLMTSGLSRLSGSTVLPFMLSAARGPRCRRLVMGSLLLVCAGAILMALAHPARADSGDPGGGSATSDSARSSSGPHSGSD